MNKLVSLTTDDFPLKNVYVGIPLPKPLRAPFQKLQSMLPTSTSFQNPKTAHITFSFIGEVVEFEFETLVSDIESFVQNFHSIPIEMTTVDYFSKRNNDKIMYWSVNSPALNRIHEHWEVQFPRWHHTNRKFIPHITLGRVTLPEFKELLDHTIVEQASCSWHVQKIEICSIYKRLHQTSLYSFSV